jgi:hypothetical protein
MIVKENCKQVFEVDGLAAHRVTCLPKSPQYDLRANDAKRAKEEYFFEEPFEETSSEQPSAVAPLPYDIQFTRLPSKQQSLSRKESIVLVS